MATASEESKKRALEATSGGSKEKQLTQEQIVSGFNKIRQEQRELASKVAELTSDLSEHSVVVDTLKDVEGDRKCFRLIGGVLVERTVKEVLPALERNIENIEKTIVALKEKIITRGQELVEYKERHGIRIQGEGAKSSGGAAPPQEEDDGEHGAGSTTQGVLVSAAAAKNTT